MSIITRIKEMAVGNKMRFTSGGSGLLTPPEANLNTRIGQYSQVGWLFACVSSIAHSVADANLRLYKNTRGELKEITEHPALELIKKVNGFQTYPEFIELQQSFLELAGRNYWYCVRSNERAAPVEIWSLPPANIAIVPDRQNYIKGYVYTVGSEKIPFETWEIICTRYPDPSNPLGGVGPAQAAGLSIDTSVYAQRWNRKFFFNDASAGTVIIYPKEYQLNDTEYEKVKERWNKEHRGIANNNKVAVLSGGVTVSNLMQTRKDMDFVNLLGKGRDDIIGTFGIPLSVLGITENVNRANAEAGDYTFARRVIKPRLTLIESKLNEQFAPMFGEGLEFHFDSIIPEDRQALVSECDLMVRAGIYTREYAQYKLGTSPDEMKGGTYFIPFSSMPETAKSYKKQFSDAQGEAYWKRYIERTERQEVGFKRVLKALFEEQQKEVIADIEVHGQEASFNQDNAIERFSTAFEPMITACFESSYQNAIPDKSFKQLNQLALEWILTRSLKLAKLVNGTTIEELREALAEGFALGESIPDIVRRIEQFYTNGYERRAPVVARTEVIAASNEGAIERYESEGVEKVEFYAALDERLCPECASLHNREFPVRESHGIIPVHPQCRCTWLPVVK